MSVSLIYPDNHVRYCSRPCGLVEVILLLLVRNFMFLIKRRNILPLHIKGLGCLLSLLKNGFDRFKLKLSYVAMSCGIYPDRRIVRRNG
ncbi:hypothetical protein BFAG_03690 [Bacteroides fragilis 3_1_12]|uniref:Uncharacterized protein n=1 Tax=Bacteroides fragilis 3_1_12 TaxID=457424 RepID=A0ABN0BQ06_BACFG|nr:hypothetical protein BFAG_03690 [Bacteroides fragilis 3_1_12]